MDRVQFCEKVFGEILIDILLVFPTSLTRGKVFLVTELWTSYGAITPCKILELKGGNIRGKRRAKLSVRNCYRLQMIII